MYDAMCLTNKQGATAASREGHLGQGEPEDEDKFSLIVQRNPRQHDVLTRSFGQIPGEKHEKHR